MFVLRSGHKVGRLALSAATEIGTPGMPARMHVVALVAAVFIPILLLSAILGERLMASERTRFEGDVAASARSIGAVTERELVGLIETLEALSVSSALATGDIQEFHNQASTLSRTLGLGIVLRDAETGRQLANTLVPWGQPLPGRSSLVPWDAALRRSSSAIVSDHYVGILGGIHSFAVAMAVRDADGHARYLLHLGIPVERLRVVLASIAMRPGWVAAVVDRTGTVVARSNLHAEAVGQRAIMADRLSEADAGSSGRVRDREGRDVFYAVHRSAAFGWLVVTLAPTEDVEGPLLRMLRIGALAFGVLAGGSLLGAWLHGSRLTHPIQALAAFGASLDQGINAPAVVTPLREVNQVGATLARAAVARAEADRRQRLILNELNHRVKNTLATVQALTTLTAREASDIRSYRDRLVARLAGLARTQVLLTNSEWRGAQLRDLLYTELEIHDGGQTTGAPRVDLAGPAVLIASSKVVALGMVVHELATNAAKYGALSVPEGRLHVRWTTIGQDDAGRPVLRLDWEEIGGPPVTLPTREGFGTRMIRKGLSRQLGATIQAEYRPSGLRFTLTMPIETETVG